MLAQLEITGMLATFQWKTQNLITEDARRTQYLHKIIWKRGIRFRPSNQFSRHKMSRLQWARTKTDNSQTRCQPVWSMEFNTKDTKVLILVLTLQERQLSTVPWRLSRHTLRQGGQIEHQVTCRHHSQQEIWQIFVQRLQRKVSWSQLSHHALSLQSDDDCLYILRWRNL